MKTKYKQHNPKALLVENDLNLAYFVRRKLEQNDIDVRVIDNGRLGEQHAMSSEYDLLMLDVGLPDVSGTRILNKVRSRSLKTPVIMIAETVTKKKELESFKSGANIFHPKPVDFELLEAQVNSLVNLKRADNVVELGDLYIDTYRQLIIKNGSEVNLSYKEFILLSTLVEAEGNILNRRDILHLTFKGAKESETGSIDTLVSRVRKKIGSYMGSPVIETVHSRGFRLNLEYFR